MGDECLRSDILRPCFWNRQTRKPSRELLYFNNCLFLFMLFQKQVPPQIKPNSSLIFDVWEGRAGSWTISHCSLCGALDCICLRQFQFSGKYLSKILIFIANKLQILLHIQLKLVCFTACRPLLVYFILSQAYFWETIEWFHATIFYYYYSE